MLDVHLHLLSVRAALLVATTSLHAKTWMFGGLPAPMNC
jgi:hypothetical protein